jgi:hypothetical protein
MLHAFLTHLNMTTLALALFVAFALLTTLRGNEPETKRTAHVGDSGPELTVGPCNTSSPQGKKFRATNSAKDFGNKVARNQ